MDRRSALRAAGTGIAALAGCLGGGTSTPTGPRNGADLPADDDPDDGYPPAFETTPAPREFDVDSFETTEREGIAVPLAPIEATYHWYARGEARFVDARGPPQYERSHVYGAVLSPAPEGLANDPVADWPETARIVCYCGCPHHLSSIRAARLLADGYENVAVIDEGFWEWHDRAYPMAGSEIDARPAARVVRGVADARFAGATAWARHPPTAQQEATTIGGDGRYRLELRFSGLTPDSVLAIETPGYRVRAPLAELVAGVVSPP